MISIDTIQCARRAGEQKAGRPLADDEFPAVLEYTLRKLQMNNLPEDYLPWLLANEVKNAVYQSAINHVSHEFMAVCSAIDAIYNGGRPDDVRVV